MMYNTRYLPENFDQCRLEKTILGHFPYNLNVRASWNALIQEGGKNHEKAYYTESQSFTHLLYICILGPFLKCKEQRLSLSRFFQ